MFFNIYIYIYECIYILEILKNCLFILLSWLKILWQPWFTDILWSPHKRKCFEEVGFLVQSKQIAKYTNEK